jgi:hypothetical protein
VGIHVILRTWGLGPVAGSVHPSRRSTYLITGYPEDL